MSVVMAARDVAGTLPEAIESLQAQTLDRWELLIIDDASSDGTAEVAAAYAKTDSRIRLLRRRKPGGSGAARNLGLRRARAQWLYFLDADDWILPNLLERLFDCLRLRPGLDAVHCGWAKAYADGRLSEDGFGPPGEDLFRHLARRPAFVIHSCIVRRRLVEEVGAFDESLIRCQDWDLWQRVARAGARFGLLRESLARYRMRPGSGSMDAATMARHGFEVIDRGHRKDPRVRRPAPSHRQGEPPEGLASAKLSWLYWSAGLALGSGGDALGLLDLLGPEQLSRTDAASAAESLASAAVSVEGRSPEAFPEVWPRIESETRELLSRLEERSGDGGLARRVLLALERRALEQSSGAAVTVSGWTQVAVVEVSEPLRDIAAAGSAERVHLSLRLEGEPLGTLLLPVCDGRVSAPVIADAVAADHFWSLLGRFFGRTLYPSLDLRPDGQGVSAWRGGVQIASGLTRDEAASPADLHDRVGWTLFLQELWGRPEWTEADFYNPEREDVREAAVEPENGWVVVEASEAMPEVRTPEPEARVLLTVGGSAVASVTLPAPAGVIPPQTLRASLCAQAGAELCRAAVREALVGRAMGGGDLRARLLAAAARRTAAAVTPPPLSVAEVPGWERAVGRETAAEPRALVARRAFGPPGTSASRRADLPLAALREVSAAAEAAGEPMVVPSEAGGPRGLAYAPGLFWTGASCEAPEVPEAAAAEDGPNNPFGKHHFESLYAQGDDPWGYLSPYEQRKYEQTLGILPHGRFEDALEIACAEGLFTERLAPRTRRLTAADISELALRRAAARCARHPNTRFVLLDLTKDEIPGRYDLIVCSEVLYYMGGLEGLQAAARKIRDALKPGGHLAMTHSNLVVDEPDRPGYDWDLPYGGKVIGQTFADLEDLRLVRELRTPLYRVQLFQREEPAPSQPFLFAPPPAEPVLEEADCLPPKNASRVLWQGGSPRRDSEQGREVTSQLPILAYHRISDEGKPSRWRVSARAFEEQIRYLRGAGFRGVSLDEWARAALTRSPVEGRGVAITFDDGYGGLREHAWPVLQQYGFCAAVFVVSGHVGGRAEWWDPPDEAPSLMGWDELEELARLGMEIECHTHRHQALTGLSPEEIARDISLARAEITRRLGRAPRAFAYPYGDTDPVVQHLVGACGFVYGLTCQPRAARLRDPLLALPRIEVEGQDSLETFIAKLSY